MIIQGVNSILLSQVSRRIRETTICSKEKREKKSKTS